MTAPTTGKYGEQGDFATDDQLEDTLRAAGVDELTADKPAAARTGPDLTTPIPGGGPLLAEASPAKVYKAVDGIVLRQDRLARNREEKERHWKRVRNGTPFCYLEKSEDRSTFRASVALGVDDDTGQPVPNKMDDLCHKIVSQLLVDDFLPNPKPDGDGDRDRGAADLTKKFLRADGTASGTDDKQLLRDALNANMTGASAFAFVWVDPTGGGWRPKQVHAHPQATDAAKPMYGPRLGPDGQPVQVTGADGQPTVIMEKATSPVLRYVAEVPAADGAGEDAPEGAPGLHAEPTLVFTENPAEAVRQWLPKHRRRMLGVNQVRTVPQSATVFEADQIILLMYDTVGEARKRFPVLDELDDVKLRAVCDWRPKRWKAVVAEAHRPKDAEGARIVTDDTLILWYEALCRIGPRYPDGGQVAVNGANGGVVLLRDTLREDVELEDGTTVPVLMDPPITQYTAVPDIEDSDPFGMAPISRFGGSKEAWDHLWIGFFDAMHKTLNPNVFIPGTSPVSREDYNRRDGTPIELLTAADKPIQEEAPEFPSFLPAVLDRLEGTMNSAAGTNETSNGLDSPMSVSGVAKDIAIKQARVALAQYWQNTVKGHCHFWRIKTQLAQAKLTVPQIVKLSGIESAYKQQWFVGADLFGVNEIPLAPGSGTMMQPSEKAQWLQVMQTNLWIEQEEAGELARSSMSDDLGLPPNVHEECVNREIAAWANGAPPGWDEQNATYQQQMAEYQATAGAEIQQLVATGVDQATATAQVQQMAPPPQPPPSPFEHRPNNQEQTVAIVRHKKLSRVTSTVEYTKHGPAWRALLDAEYERMRQAAGVATVAEQQAAAQAQADQATRQQQDGEQTKRVAGEQHSADAERERAFKAQEAERDRETDLEKTARTAMSREPAVGSSSTSSGPARPSPRRGASPLPA